MFNKLRLRYPESIARAYCFLIPPTQYVRANSIALLASCLSNLEDDLATTSLSQLVKVEAKGSVLVEADAGVLVDVRGKTELTADLAEATLFHDVAPLRLVANCSRSRSSTVAAGVALVA